MNTVKITAKILASVFLATLIFSSLGWADQGSAIDPSQLCEGNPCSQPMINISQQYKEGFADFAGQDLSAYSGKCFHMNSMYDPNYAHYGAFVFAKSSQRMMISGLFGFFYDEDPYSGMNAEEMKSAFEKSGSNGAPGIVRPDHIELAYIYPVAELRYWFRSDKSKKTLFMIGRQADNANGISSLVFCKMLRH